MHISILTASGCYNLWDELIVQEEIRFLRERWGSNVSISIFTYDKNSVINHGFKGIQTVQYFPSGLRTHPFRNFISLFRNILTLMRSDLIIIGWGWLFYDNEKTVSIHNLLRQWRWRFWISKALRKPILLWSVGIHMKKGHMPSLVAMLRDTTCSVRDTRSAELISELHPVIIPDPVFLYTPRIKNKSTKRIGLALRQWYLRQEEESIAAMIRTIRSEGFEPVFLPHSFHPTSKNENDYTFCEPYARKHGCALTTTMKDTLDAYPYLSAVITMRLHANILSFAHEIPFFALSYSTKTDAILHDINHEDMLACATFHADVFQKKFSAFREALPERKLALQEKNTIMKAYLHTQLTQLFDGLESAPSKSGGPDS